MLYLRTDQAEHLVKLLHFGLSSASLFMVCQIVLKYFKQDKRTAQFVVLMLLFNQEIREFNQMLFNDAFLSFYITLCFYLLFVKNQPLKASLAATAALGMKAGAVLVLPGLLGFLHYQHGTLTLLSAVFIIVGFQVAIASPFCFDPVAQTLGFKSAGTHWKDYLHYTKFLGGDKKRQYGSMYDLTIYFQFIDRQIYYKQWFIDGLKLAMLSVNVWYFFIRRACIFKCFLNIFNTFKHTNHRMSLFEMQKGLEILVIGLVAGS